MAWIGVITNAGAALLAQWAAGDHTLTIDGAKVGSGYVSEANMRIATALQSQKDTAEIVSAEETQEGTQFRVRVHAVDGASYTAHEIGLWAHIDNDESVMIALHQDSTIGVVVPTAESMPGFFFDLYCVHAIGNEGDLNITLSTTTFATRDELAEDIAAAEEKMAPAEETATASQEYVEDDFLIYDGEMYKATNEIDEGDTLTPGENIEQTSLGSELTTVKKRVDSIIQLSAFTIEVEGNGDLALYWYGAQGVCPFTIALENGAYVLYFTFETA